MSTYRIHTITSEHTVEGVHGINYVNHLLFFNTEGKVFAGFAADTWERFEKVEDDNEVLPATGTTDEPVQVAFNKGDHVRVEPGTKSLYGGLIPSPYRGVVWEPNDFSDDHVNVDFEGRPGSVMVKADLIKTTPPVPDESLANWERELLFRVEDYPHGKVLDLTDVKALPDGSKVQDIDEDVWTLGDDGYWFAEDDEWTSPEGLFDYEPITFYNPPAATVHEATSPTYKFKVGDKVRILPDARYCHNRYDVELDGDVTHDSVGIIERLADTQGDLLVQFPSDSYYVNAAGLALAYAVGTVLTYEQFSQAPTGTKAQHEGGQLVFTKTDAGSRITHYDIDEPRPEHFHNDRDLEWDAENGHRYVVVA